MSSQRAIDIWFGDQFIKGFAKNITSNWEIAIVELIANSYDAGAKIVNINIPTSNQDFFIIEDDGIGMTRDEFLNRWSGLGYDRLKNQGKDVLYPDGTKANRIAYGKNGKGRFAMYCFSDIYYVETWKFNEYNKFEVKKGEKPFEIRLLSHEDNLTKKKTGTKLYCKLTKILTLEGRNVKDLIGSKFILDPTFKIVVNNEQITEKDLGSLISEDQVLTHYGIITIKIISTKPGRTSQQNGIAWWVHNRLVGKLSWQLSDGEKLDRRYREAHLYSFIIIADILEQDVLDDWTGFQETQRFSDVYRSISDFLVQKVDELFESKRTERKKNIFNSVNQDLKQLQIISRDKIAEIFDQILKNCPHFRDSDLENVLKILIELEKSNSQYKLLEKLASLNSKNFDELTSILSEWQIEDAKLVLYEIKNRLDIINKLSQLTETHSDELHQLQPLIKESLWMFGPEYDSVQYFSNKTITTILSSLLKEDYKNNIDLRPDFVIIPNDFSIGVYSTDDYNLKGEVIGIRKIVILELKKGQSTISDTELNQAKKYAKILITEGHLPKNTQIICYVLGTKIDELAQEEEKIGSNIIIKPMSYCTLLEIANARLIHLKQKIEENKKLRDKDLVIAELSKQRNLLELRSYNKSQ